MTKTFGTLADRRRGYKAGSVVTVGAPAAPSAPVLTGVADLTGTTKQVTITSIPANANAVIREVSLNSGSYQTAGSNLATSATTFNYDVGSATSWAFRIRAVNDGGESANSNVVNGALIAVPSAPVLGAITAQSGTIKRVAITTMPGTATYITREVALNGGAYISAGSNVASDATYFEYDVGAATSWAFRSKAGNAGGLSIAYSNIVSGNTAAPGVVLTGGILTITGTGFPAKTRAQPVVFDNFAGATIGASIHNRTPAVWNANARNSWSGTSRDGGPTPVFTNSGSRVAGKPSLYHNLDLSYNCSADIWHTLASSGQSAVYKCAWYKTHTPNGSPRQWKPTAIYGSRDGTMPEEYLGFGNYEAGVYGGFSYSEDGSLRTSTQDTGITNTVQYGPINWNEVLERFFMIEEILVQSTANTANGMLARRIYDPDNPAGPYTDWEIVQNIKTRGSGISGWQQFCTGHYSGGRKDAGGGELYAWTDDIYFDDSHARVVIGNNSVYTACTRIEPQIGRVWNANSQLELDYNRGGFIPGQTIYIFTVDGAGFGGHGSARLEGSVTAQ